MKKIFIFCAFFAINSKAVNYDLLREINDLAGKSTEFIQENAPILAKKCSLFDVYEMSRILGYAPLMSSGHSQILSIFTDEFEEKKSHLNQKIEQIFNKEIPSNEAENVANSVLSEGFVTMEFLEGLKEKSDPKNVELLKFLIKQKMFLDDIVLEPQTLLQLCQELGEIQSFNADDFKDLPVEEFRSVLENEMVIFDRKIDEFSNQLKQIDRNYSIELSEAAKKFK